jgi:signal transduction histidine kinase
MPGENPQAGKDPAGGRDDSRVVRRRVPAAFVASTVFLGASQPVVALAQNAIGSGWSFGSLEVIQLAMFAGVMGAALLSAVWMIRERARIAAENGKLRGRVADLSTALQRSEALLNLRDQRVVVWSSDSDKAELIGVLPRESGVPEDRAAFLAFGRWLTPRSAAALEQAITALRDSATAFDLVVETQGALPLEVHGRKTPQQVFVRFLSLSEAQRVQARLRLENQRLSSEYETFLGLAEALKMPIWLRGTDGRLRWVNRAYADAVEANDAAAAVRDSKEFLGTQARESITQHHLHRTVFEQKLATVVAGDRRVFGVTDFAGPEGSAGLAVDLSDADTVRAEFERTVRNHADTLDQLNTAVAIFDADQKLRFFNQAFQKLWDVEVSFLESAPDNNLLLDRLRTDGKLEEQPEWRRWKENLLSVYRSVESHEHWWHLPGGRTIRVIANPQPKGGVTWVFENLTERMDLESRYHTAVRVQGETLDNLAEGVAVFGPDGRVRLANPAFPSLWGLDPAVAQPGTHISAIRAACERMVEQNPWSGFVAAVTGFDEERRDQSGQIELRNGTSLRFAVIHLPNGQVMITFVDVTDSVNIQRALKDKNDALQRADQLKNDFVQHVSYELRSPLTNIIGFTELMALPATGPLNARQREYVDHIGSSSGVLLTIVNDILDLATVDAGIMQLDISEVRVDQAIDAASEIVGERLREHSIDLEIDTSRAPASFNADEHRVRQVLSNLLSNAANYAPEGSTVKLTCAQIGDAIEFAVHDDGPGMAPEVLDTVFRRFESRSNGGRRRGAGLGLSIVKSFVELHGGTVAIDSRAEHGTTVICRFPLTPPSNIRQAAE